MNEEELMPGEEQASPEEQQQLEQAFDLALQMIHGQGAAGDQIAQMVMQSKDIQQGLGQAVATVIIGVDKKMPLSGDLKVALAKEVLGELAELAAEAGAIAEDEITDDFMDKVVSHAYSQYLSAKEAMGELDQNELQASVTEAQAAFGQKPAQPQQAAKGGLLQRAAQGA